MISFPGAHGEEVVRDLLVLSNTKMVITCGEDGNIKLWELPHILEVRPITNKDESVDVVMEDSLAEN